MLSLRHAALAVFCLGVTTSLAKGDEIVVDGKLRTTGLLRKPVAEDVEFQGVSLLSMGPLPASYDAREAGLVTRIKNQGNCGSCWSFARAKALEAAVIHEGISSAAELDLAEQDALVNDKTAYGCNGGFMDATYEVKYGVTTEALCPYRASTRYSCKAAKYAKALRWGMVGQRKKAPSIDELKAALIEYGVLAVTVAAGRSFSPGKDGRITSCGGRGINHMVNLVGYRTQKDGTTEFLIANSWGTSWGSKGYAWSRQGCNQLASSPGDAALFISMQ